MPAPTPRAGLPHEYAAFTIALPPVARIVATPGWFMRAPVAASDGVSTHWMQCSGAPAATAASRTMRAAATEHCCALGWNAKMIGLRVFREMRALKIAVDVGLVTGVMPAITPTGSAISVMPLMSSTLMTPTVRRLAIEFVTCSHAKMFFTALSSKTPRPVSSTASLASCPCWSRAATAPFLTKRSTSSCVMDSNSASALVALATSRSTARATSSASLTPRAVPAGCCAAAGASAGAAAGAFARVLFLVVSDTFDSPCSGEGDGRWRVRRWYRR